MSSIIVHHEAITITTTFAIIIIYTNLVACIDFSKVVNWEKRTLTCFGNDIQNGANYGAKCKLTIADSSKLLETECFDEKYMAELFGETRK
ncbi:hypothetical protein LOAG_11020, partial [Loa loa]